MYINYNPMCAKYKRWVLPPIGLIPPIKENKTIDTVSLEILNKIYIGNISIETQEKEILNLFMKFGSIVNIHLSVDYKTGKHKGFGFIEFSNPHGAFLLLNKSKGFALNGKDLKIGRPINFPKKLTHDIGYVNRKVIYISNIHPDLDITDLKSIFECFGEVKNIEILVENKKNLKRFVKCAYLKFNCEFSVICAIKVMDGFKISGVELRVGHTVLPVKFKKEEKEEVKIPENIYKITKKIEKVYEISENDILVLKNLVNIEEVDLDFVEELKNEMLKFGDVEDFKVAVFKKPIYNIKDIFHLEKKEDYKDTDVLVFIKFKEEKVLYSSMEILKNRFFGGKLIKAEIWSFERFKEILKLKN